MNHIYRVIWNAQNACWQAVSELARGKTKSTTTVSTSLTKPLMRNTSFGGLFAVNLLAASVAIAGPTGGVVSAGTATINTSGTTTTINQSTAKAAIDWTSFSTGSTETVNFVQPGASSITLNRITGTSASTLNGKLNANGQIFIINPNGVLFGTTSQVNTGGLVASTLNMSNTDFLNNNFNFVSSTNNKTVENRGKITVPTGGTVALIAPSIKHTGTITTPEGSTLLAAGSDITLTLNNGSLVGYTINQGKAQALINSGGMIKADGGKVILTAKGVDELSNAVVNSVGIIEAKTVSTKRGVIELGSDMVSGTVNVSGTLDASAPTTGNGGLIKTSASNVQVNAGANITTRRVSQSALPPTTSGWEVTTNTVDVDQFSGINSTALSNALDKGNVTLKAVGTEPEQGNININDATSWSANTALTVTAAKDINFNNEMTLSGDKAKLAMNYDAVNSYDYNLAEGAKINITGSLPTLLINGTAYTVINELGEEGDASVTTLQGMKNNLTGNYALGSDIDASDTVNWNEGKGFDPVGKITSSHFSKIINEGIFSSDLIDEGTPYSGNFHGLGHQVSNLNIASPMSNTPIHPDNTAGTTQGLFGATLGNVRDIALLNNYVTGDVFVGGLVGLQLGGTIKNASSQGAVKGQIAIGGLIGGSGFTSEQTQVIASHANNEIEGRLDVGGLIGISTTKIYNSYSLGNIVSNFNDFNIEWPGVVGGLVGTTTAGIYNSYSAVNIDADLLMVGGLAGLVRFDETDNRIENSYATGDITGKQAVGGLIGVTIPGGRAPEPKFTVVNSYATGNVTGSREVGGLIGENIGNNNVIGSYSTGQVNGQLNIGGLIGANSGGLILISHASGNVSGEENVGGIVGENGKYFGGSLGLTYSTGEINGLTNVGGIVGKNNGSVDVSYSTSNVTGGTNVGGAIGKNESYITDSYAVGAVSGNTNIGGLVGNNDGVNRNATVSTSYSAGSVTGNSNVGGLVGTQGINSVVTNSYWDTPASGQLTSAGGTGKTTAELKQISTFTDWLISDGSDPNAQVIWFIDENNSMPTFNPGLAAIYLSYAGE